MNPKTPLGSEIYEQMLAMLADQFYHQPGDNIIINREELAEMLMRQTMHGIELGENQTKDTPNEQYKCPSYVEGGKVIDCNCGKCF